MHTYKMLFEVGVFYKEKRRHLLMPTRKEKVKTTDDKAPTGATAVK